MDCNIVKDLLPLYVDGCCSEESEKAVLEHIRGCDDCKKLLKDMKSTTEIVSVSNAPKKLCKLNDWKASVLQSVLLFISFALITIGVALEASTPYGFTNGYWAFALVIPSTGFMLSLANWYFVRVYKNRKIFSNCSLLATLTITVGAYIWSGFYYDMALWELFAGNSFLQNLEILHALFYLNAIGISLTVVFCVMSKIFSNQYAKMSGKE